jgi:hypothetical protein
MKFPTIGPARFAAIVAFTLCFSFAGSAFARPATDNAIDIGAANAADSADAALKASLCQVVYPLDETTEDGYRYMFFGNGFFINDQGYILTAAHLLGYFRNGGIPYILVGPPEGPRRMIEAPIAAIDWDHDVAVLKASPNPLATDKKLDFLRISSDSLAKGSGVVSASLRPPDTENAHSSQPPMEDFAHSQVIDYLFFRDKGQQSELLLFNQDVVPGQSGSPLVSADTNEVVGVVVGKWLHPTVLPSGANGGHVTMAPGAALRIHYAISLLDQLHVSWNPAEVNATQPVAHVAQTAALQVAVSSPAPTSAPPQAQAQTQRGYVPPSPVSVVGVPYPPQALFGGEVFLDALVDADGKLADVRVINGDEPFLDVVLEAVHTWSFTPARVDGRAVEARIGIAFQFPQSFLPGITPRARVYKEALADAGERGALPIATIEPDYPINSIAEGSVILYATVDAQGQVGGTSGGTSVVRDVPSLTVPTEAAVHQWKFAAGKQAGTKTDSAVVVVVTFRRPTQ